MRIVRAIQFPYRTAGVHARNKDPFDGHKFKKLERKLANLSGREVDNHTSYVFQTDTGKWFCASFSDWKMFLREGEGTKELWLDERPSHYIFSGKTESTKDRILRELREAGLGALAYRCEQYWR